MVRGREVVALMPAAGRSRRLAPLPCSKELLPIGFGSIRGAQGPRLKVSGQYLLECFEQANIRKGYLVIREGKWDIPAYWCNGDMVAMDLAYLVIKDSIGPPDTIDRANSFVKDKIIAFGFPDIVFRPKNVFVKLLKRLEHSRSDVVLALFPTRDSKGHDMVDIDAFGRVRAIQLKPSKTCLKYGWLCAVWTPAFTDFLHQLIRRVKKGQIRGLIGNRKIDSQGDVPVGAVLKEALRANLKVEGVLFKAGRYIDIGTPRGLSLVQRITFN
jgi:glucose-1-phosphate thymidylyltransferase